jgi:hypothetical protein
MCIPAYTAIGSVRAITIQSSYAGIEATTSAILRACRGSAPEWWFMTDDELRERVSRSGEAIRSRNL